MLFLAWFPPPAPNTGAPPIPMKLLALGAASVFVLLAVWGISTAVGLFRRRPWSRISILIFATFLSLFSGVAMLMIFVIPMPETPGADPEILAMTRRVMAGMYGGLGAIGVWWLVLFNRGRGKAYFTELEAGTESGRPLSISVLAWYLIGGGLSILAMALLGMPSIFFGLILTGWAAVLVYFGFAATQMCLGVGLLRLREWARAGSIAYFCVMAVNGLVSSSPSRQQELMRQMRLAWPWLNQPGQEAIQTGLHWPMYLVMLVIAGVPIYFLHRRRAAFPPAQ